MDDETRERLRAERIAIRAKIKRREDRRLEMAHEIGQLYRRLSHITSDLEADKRARLSLAAERKSRP